MSRKAPVAPMLAAAIGCICFFAVLGFALPSLAAPVDSVSVPAGAQISVSGSTMSLRANGVSGTYNCSCSSQGGTCVRASFKHEAQAGNEAPHIGASGLARGAGSMA